MQCDADVSAHEGMSYPFPEAAGGPPDAAGRDYGSLKAPDYIGEGEGRGFSCNVAWSERGYGDAEYALLTDKLLRPLAASFRPQLVLISAGFDSAAGDEEEFEVTPAGYAYMVQALLEAAEQSRVVVVLVSSNSSDEQRKKRTSRSCLASNEKPLALSLSQIF